MPRIEPILIDEAQGKGASFSTRWSRVVVTPGPMVRGMANAPALLRGDLDLSRAMKRSHIDRPTIKRINLAVHGHLRCDYCIAAHTRAAHALAVPDSEIELALRGTPGDPAIAALVAFALQVLTEPGQVDHAALERLHAHGYDDEQIAEVAGLVAQRLLTGSFNLLAGIHAPPADET